MSGTGARPALVVFDLDGVLCRYRLDARLEALSARCGKPAAEIRALIWESGFEDQADAGLLDAAEYLAGFGQRLGIPLTLEEWVTARLAGMRLDHEMLALVGRIRATTAVLTNNGWLTRETLPRLVPEVLERFAGRVFVSAELGAKKPEPEVYHRLAARLGVAGADAVMVDDNAANAAGAIAAGWTGHHFSDRERLTQYLAGLGLLP